MSEMQGGNKVAYLIREIHAKLNHNVKEQFKDSGLTVPQINVLQLIGKHGQLKVSDISEKMSLVNSTVSGIVDRLEKQQIVKRVRSQKDKRMVYIELEDKGKELISEFRGIINNYFDYVFSSATEEEMKKMIEGLETINKVLDN